MSSRYKFKWLKNEESNDSLKFELTNRLGSKWNCLLNNFNLSDDGFVSFNISQIDNKSEISEHGMSLIRYNVKKIIRMTCEHFEKTLLSDAKMSTVAG